MLNKYFCAIFIIGYNLISYTNNDHIRTGPVSLQKVMEYYKTWSELLWEKEISKKPKSITYHNFHYYFKV